MSTPHSAGFARLDLEQAERRYFAIPIFTFCEFIKNHVKIRFLTFYGTIMLGVKSFST